MIPIAPQNAASTKIAVTNAATKLYTLMNTAGSVANSEKYYQDLNANGLIITPEDGGIRILTGVNPTATVGTILYEGVTYFLPNQNLSDLRLIRVGGSNVACSVEPYFSNPAESAAAVGGEPNVQEAATVYPSGLSLAGCGELQGSATALQNPTLACKMVKYKASVANGGNVYLGGAGVTKPDATTDTTTGMQLSPGDDSGWLPVSNTNLFYRICDNATDALTFIALT